MTTVVYKPRIQCRYRDDEDRQCPPDILGEGGLLQDPLPICQGHR